MLLCFSRESTMYPLNVPVLLNARGTGPYTWSIVTNPSIHTLYDATTKNPYFIPDMPGNMCLMS